MITPKAEDYPAVEILEDLRRLRKSLGVMSPNVAMRIRPDLRRLARISENDPEDVQQSRLIATLRRYTESLQPAHASLIDFGFNLSGTQDMLTHRIEQLALELQCDTRTARRRMDAALRLLAFSIEKDLKKEAGASESAQPYGWYLDVFEAVVRLDRPSPMILERRTIVVTQESLDHVDVKMSLPRHPANETGPHKLQVEVIRGGILRHTHQKSSSLFESRIDLPRTLHRGDTHTYELMFTVPEGQPIRPHYAFTPNRACDEFNLVVRFPLNSLPTDVHVLDGVPTSVLFDPELSGPQISPDGAGEVTIRNRDLIPGLAYGIRWQ